MPTSTTEQSFYMSSGLSLQTSPKILIVIQEPTHNNVQYGTAQPHSVNIAWYFEPAFTMIYGIYQIWTVILGLAMHKNIDLQMGLQQCTEAIIGNDKVLLAICIRSLGIPWKGIISNITFRMKQYQVSLFHYEYKVCVGNEIIVSP